MEERHLRTAQLLGQAGVQRLQKAHVAVFGLGGVGGYAAEALARAGVGALSLFDADVFSPSNLNRQLCAVQSTLGQPKVQVFAAHIAGIDPAIRVQAHRVFYLPETADAWPLDAYDYVLDAVDTVAAKLELAVRAHAAGVPIASAMGCGNKLDPTAFTVTDIFATHTDPLARVLRRELKKRGVPRLKVVYSTEAARTPCLPGEEKGTAGRPARRRSSSSRDRPARVRMITRASCRRSAEIPNRDGLSRLSTQGPSRIPASSIPTRDGRRSLLAMAPRAMPSSST